MESLKARGCCKEKHLEVNDENLERVDSYFGSCSKLESYDWLREISDQDIAVLLHVTKCYYRDKFHLQPLVICANTPIGQSQQVRKIPA